MNTTKKGISILVMLMLILSAYAQKISPEKIKARVLNSEFIYEIASFRSCHASTVVETDEGILAAWFGGTGEGRPDVCIYTSINKNGTILYPTSIETKENWNIYVETSDQGLNNWRKTKIDNSGFNAIQPTILFYKGGKIQMLCRSKEKGIVETWSKDQGKT
jgi:predicted neuraminidase